MTKNEMLMGRAMMQRMGGKLSDVEFKEAVREIFDNEVKHGRKGYAPETVAKLKYIDTRRNRNLEDYYEEWPNASTIIERYKKDSRAKKIPKSSFNKKLKKIKEDFDEYFPESSYGKMVAKRKGKKPSKRVRKKRKDTGVKRTLTGRAKEWNDFRKKLLSQGKGAVGKYYGTPYLVDEKNRVTRMSPVSF